MFGLRRFTANTNKTKRSIADMRTTMKINDTDEINKNLVIGVKCALRKNALYKSTYILYFTFSFSRSLAHFVDLYCRSSSVQMTNDFNKNVSLSKVVRTFVISNSAAQFMTFGELDLRLTGRASSIPSESAFR